MRVKLWCFLVIGFLSGVLALPSGAPAIDAPHDMTNIPSYCWECHKSHGASYPSLLSELCQGCHYDTGPAPGVSSHCTATGT